MVLLSYHSVPLLVLCLDASSAPSHVKAAIIALFVVLAVRLTAIRYADDRQLAVPVCLWLCSDVRSLSLAPHWSSLLSSFCGRCCEVKQQLSSYPPIIKYASTSLPSAHCSCELHTVDPCGIACQHP